MLQILFSGGGAQGKASARASALRLLTRSILGVAPALAATPALAESPEYPPGLFENSPIVPSGPPNAAGPSGDADVPPGPLGSPADDYCAGIEFRTFRNLAEVRQAHARCDPVQSEFPPPAKDPPKE